MKVDGNMNMTVGRNFAADVGGTTSWNSAGNYSVNAPRIDLN